ncbi:MAG TPA: hydroxymethylglutaryl-CoA reductase, partial [Thermoanaerobaculia bacterium]|nr:hydroxymethylglutaryl-CoA reductase [Thermoanaerobaculia bacterium]
DERARDLRPRHDPLPPGVPAKDEDSAAALETRRAFLRERGFAIDQLTGAGEEIAPEALHANIESLVGFARIPVGVIGPLRVNGVNAKGDFYVPMATTEGALVASYQRGAKMIGLAGGCASLCLVESVLRAPGFAFTSLAEAGTFVAHVIAQFEAMQGRVSETSRHARLVQIDPLVSGKEVYLVFHYTTGDAAGQNMVTFATNALCRHLIDSSPVKPQTWFIEANMSGDKKATQMAFQSTRGKKVVADVTIPREIVRKYLHTEPEQIFRYWQMAVVGSLQSGSIGMQGHFANALAALFIACGQDVACVSEAAVGLTRMDVTPEGDFYCSISLPNLIVGTVGGGTHLPTARECLEMLGCYGPGGAKKFAEICAAVVLCGEVSIAGALASGEFTQAHQAFGRKA